MVRYRKSMKISPPSNYHTIQNHHIDHNIHILQTPLHGRECGKSNQQSPEFRQISGYTGNVCHRKYMKPFPVVVLTLSLKAQYNNGQINDLQRSRYQRFITENVIGYYFLKISLYNCATGKIEDNKLNSTKIVVGQLYKVAVPNNQHHSQEKNTTDFHSLVFEFNDLGIKSKGNYRLIFQLYKVQNTQNGPHIEKLNLVSTTPFEIFSGRKYYSEERKEERKLMLDAKNKLCEPKDPGHLYPESSGKNGGILELLKQYYAQTIKDQIIIDDAQYLQSDGIISSDVVNHYGKRKTGKRLVAEQQLPISSKKPRLNSEEYPQTFPPIETDMISTFDLTDEAFQLDQLLSEPFENGTRDSTPPLFHIPDLTSCSSSRSTSLNVNTISMEDALKLSNNQQQQQQQPNTAFPMQYPQAHQNLFNPTSEDNLMMNASQSNNHNMMTGLHYQNNFDANDLYKSLPEIVNQFPRQEEAILNTPVLELPVIGYNDYNRLDYGRMDNSHGIVNVNSGTDDLLEYYMGSHLMRKTS